MEEVFVKFPLHLFRKEMEDKKSSFPLLLLKSLTSPFSKEGKGEFLSPCSKKIICIKLLDVDQLLILRRQQNFTLQIKRFFVKYQV